MSPRITRRGVLEAGTALSITAALPGPAVASARTTFSAQQQGAVQQAAHAAVESRDIPGVVAQVWRKGELRCDVVAGMQDIEREAMDIQLQDKLLEYKQQMGLLGEGAGTTSGKQISAGSSASDEQVLEEVIVKETNEAAN